MVGLCIAVFCAPLQQQRQNGTPAIFRTDVPASDLNVIAGAPTSDSIKLSVLSSKTGTIDLKYAPESQKGTAKNEVNIDVIARSPSVITLSKLKKGETYSYTLQSKSSSSAGITGKFTTAKEAGKSFMFDIQADSHLDGNADPKVYENTLNNIIADKPDFLVDLGDTFMVDKYPNYKDSLKQYQAQRYWFSLVGQQMSVFLCLGNHDGETGWPVKGSKEVSRWAREQRETYFPVIERNAFYSGASSEGLYYSWNWGDSLFVVLDPFVATIRKPRVDTEGWNWTLGEEQFKWLEATLMQSKSKHKFVFIHHLVGGFGKEARGGVEAIDRFEWGDDKEFPVRRLGWAENIHELLKRYRVTAMFHGHDHLYVRQERDGIVYLEVPQPSHARGDNTNSAEEYGYKTGKLLGSSGHIRVTVDPKKLKLEYVKSRLIGSNREVVDLFEINDH